MSTVSSSTLSSPGVGSGLDVQTIVSKLMAVEQQPLNALDSKVQNLQTQLSAYGQLNSSLTAFQTAIGKLNDPSKFKVYSATTSDTTVASATADSTAVRGNYNIQVSRIAENHQMVSGQFADTGTTTVGASGDNMTISVGSNAFTVDIGGQTLSQVRDSINNATDNTGVTASIIQDGSSYRLLLASNDTGSANALTLSYSGADPLSLTTLNTDRNGDAVFTPSDLDASITLAGQFTSTSSSNNVSGVIQGVTLNLLKSGTITLNVAQDTNTVQANVTSFANALSGLFTTMSQLKSRGLQNDGGLLLNLEQDLRNALNASASTGGQYNYASEVGLTTQADGTVAVDATKLTAALTKDFSSVAKLFSDPTNGLAVRLSNLADGFVGANGSVQGRTDSINSQLKSLANDRTNMTARLNEIQNNYLAQYSKLDTLLSGMQTTSTYLTQQLQSLYSLSLSIANNPSKTG